MAETPTETQRAESDRAPAEGDLWPRLRESIQRLAATGRNQTDPAALAERLAARAEQLRGRMTPEGTAEAVTVLLAFHKGNQRYAVPVREVIEVQELRHFSPVPGTPPFLPGVIHWRGDVLALLDLGRLFEIPEPGLADVHVCLIVEAAGRRVAVVAHDVEEICAVPESEVRPAPELPGNVPPEWALGIHDGDRMILRLESILQDARLVDWRA